VEAVKHAPLNEKLETFTVSLFSSSALSLVGSEWHVCDQVHGESNAMIYPLNCKNTRFLNKNRTNETTHKILFELHGGRNYIHTHSIFFIITASSKCNGKLYYDTNFV